MDCLWIEGDQVLGVWRHLRSILHGRSVKKRIIKKNVRTKPIFFFKRETHIIIMSHHVQKEEQLIIQPTRKAFNIQPSQPVQLGQFLKVGVILQQGPPGPPERQKQAGHSEMEN